MFKRIEIKRMITGHPAIPAALVLAAFLFLAYLSFFYRLGGLGASLKISFGASRASFSFDSTVRLEGPRIKLQDGGEISASEIKLSFAPVSNLLYADACDADVSFGGGAGASKAYGAAAEAASSLAGKLRELGVRAERVRMRFGDGIRCESFANFKFDSPVALNGAAFEFGTAGTSPVQISASGVLVSNGSSAEISLVPNPDGDGYVFDARSLPMRLLKSRLSSRHFEFNTAEIDLAFTTPRFDLADFAAFKGISGRAANFSFVYVPFRCLLKSDFKFTIDGGKLVIEGRSAAETGAEGNKAIPRISGYVDFKNRTLSIEFISSQFDISYFSTVFSRFKNFLAHYSPSGYAKIFIKAEGPLDDPETYAELNLSGAMLQGDAGYKNINNISGKLNFINSKITLNEITGSLMSSKVSINGACDLSQPGGGDIGVNFSDIPVTEIKEYMIFNENEIEKLISSAREGRIGVTLKLSPDGGVRGGGTFSKCRLSIPIKNEVIEISDAGGNFTLGDESIEFNDSYGFVGNVPFFFTASFSKKALQNYVFNVRIQNIDFSEVIAGRSSYEFLNFISRIQAQNKSKLELQIVSDGGRKIASDLKLRLSHPDISLYPLPFSINVENVDGGIKFTYDTRDGAFELENFDFSLRGAAKIILLSFLYRSVPVSISGSLFGDIHLSQKKIITGNFSIADGVVRYFDNKYAEIFIKVSDLNAYFTVQNTVINGICKLKLLAGEARLDFRSDFASSSLASSMSFDAENINLNEIYAQNPRAPKYALGILNLNFKSVYDSKDGPGELTGTASMRGGKFINLSRLDIISKKDIVPDRIYEFNKFNFGFNLGKNKLKIVSPAFDGADKEEFLTVLKSIDFALDL